MTTSPTAIVSPRRPAPTTGPTGGVPAASERVALDIVHDIVAQGLHVGDRLPLEAAMVEQYDVSRASLREALRLLEVQGLIRLKPGPGGGPVVGSVKASHLARTATLYFHLDASTYGQLMATQVLLEPLCAQLAARNPESHDRDDAVLRRARLRVRDELSAHTSTFHNEVYRLSANPVLALVTSAITSIVADHVVATMDPVQLRGDILDEHAALARAIARGHADRAARLMAATSKRSTTTTTPIGRQGWKSSSSGADVLLILAGLETPVGDACRCSFHRSPSPFRRPSVGFRPDPLQREGLA